MPEVANNPFAPRGAYQDPRQDYDPDEFERALPRVSRHPKAYRWQGIDWLSESDAREFSGRGKTTLWDYRRRGIVKAVKLSRAGRPAEWHYTVGSLKLARRDAERRKAAQRHVAGPGRGNQHDDGSLSRARVNAERRQRK